MDVGIQPPGLLLTGFPEDGTVTTETTASFDIWQSEPGTLFCSLDGTEFAPCVSPFVSFGLLDGSHTFQVYVQDRAGERLDHGLADLDRRRHSLNRSLNRVRPGAYGGAMGNVISLDEYRGRARRDPVTAVDRLDLAVSRLETAGPGARPTASKRASSASWYGSRERSPRAVPSRRPSEPSASPIGWSIPRLWASRHRPSLARAALAAYTRPSREGTEEVSQRRALIAGIAAFLGVFVSGSVSLALVRHADEADAPVSRSASSSATPSSPQPEPGPVVDAYLAWVPDGLPPGYGATIAQLPSVGKIVVASDTIWMTSSSDADGNLVDEPPAPNMIPIDAIAIDPKPYARFMPPETRAIVGNLLDGQAILGQTSAKLRHLGPGSVMRFEGGSASPSSACFPTSSWERRRSS